jgi:glycosyltransferase involved in cell wall biosynthesis
MLGPYSFTQGALKKFLYWRLIERAHLKRAAALHSTSAMEADELAVLLPGTAIFNVPNAIDTAAWRRDEAGGLAWRARHGIAASVPVFLASGRLHHKKGLEFLAEVFAQVTSTQDWRMVFAGPDEDGTKAKLEAAFAALGASERVIFCGQCDTRELAILYSAADSLLFPSRHENFGNVAVEALACGCPVVLSAGVGAAKELAGLPGVTVAPRDASEWARAVQTVVTAGAEASGLRGALAKAVDAKFSPRAVALAVAGEYSRLITRR